MRPKNTNGSARTTMDKLNDTQGEAKYQNTNDELTQDKKRQRISKEEGSQVDGTQSTTHDMLRSATAKPAAPKTIMIDLGLALVMAHQRQSTTIPSAGQTFRRDRSAGLILSPSSSESDAATGPPPQGQLMTAATQQQYAATTNQPVAAAPAPVLETAPPTPPYHPLMMQNGLLLNQVAPQIDPATATATPTEQQPHQASAPPTAMMMYPPFPFHMAQTETGNGQHHAAPPNDINATAAHLMAMAAAAGISSHQQQQVMNMLMASQQPTAGAPIPGGGITAVSQQPQTLAGFVGLSGPPRRGPLLYMPTDDDVLSENQILLRRQVEFFEAALDDVGKTTSGRRRPIMLSQVGIQCRHCGDVPARYRQKGAIYYPAKLAGIYQAAQNMAVTHLTTLCQHIDEQTKEQLKAYQEGRSVTGHGGKQYWAGTARAQGVVEAEEGGLQFVSTQGLVPNMPPILQQHQHYTSMAPTPWQPQPPPNNGPPSTST
jgi:hypothetical protein